MCGVVLSWASKLLNVDLSHVLYYRKVYRNTTILERPNRAEDHSLADVSKHYQHHTLTSSGLLSRQLDFDGDAMNLLLVQKHSHSPKYPQYLFLCVKSIKILSPPHTCQSCALRDQPIMLKYQHREKLYL